MLTSVRGKNAERFVTPVLGLALGVLFLVIFALHDDWFDAVTSFAIMALYSVVLLVLGRRSETLGLLGGDVPDERGRAIGVKALAFTGTVLVDVIVVMFIWELAHGRDAGPWAALGAIGGVAFAGSTAWYTRHS